jgi:hypothetical protein
MGDLQERITSTNKGSITSGAGGLRAGGRSAPFLLSAQVFINPIRMLPLSQLASDWALIRYKRAW